MWLRTVTYGTGLCFPRTSVAQPRLETLFPVDMRATLRVATYCQIHPDFAHVLAARTPAIDLDVDHQV
jgi:hypothetical protein